MYPGILHLYSPVPTEPSFSPSSTHGSSNAIIPAFHPPPPNPHVPISLLAPLYSVLAPALHLHPFHPTHQSPLAYTTDPDLFQFPNLILTII